MIKKYIVIFIILSLGCKKEGIIKLERKDFLVSYPSSLILDENGEEGAVFVLRFPKEDENDFFVENINLVRVNTGDLSFKDLTSKTIKEIISVADILENRAIKVNNSDCLRIIFKLSEKGKKMKVIQHFFMKNKRVYVLTFTSEEEKFNQYYDDANSVLMSFKIK